MKRKIAALLRILFLLRAEATQFLCTRKWFPRQHWCYRAIDRMSVVLVPIERTVRAIFPLITTEISWDEWRANKSGYLVIVGRQTSKEGARFFAWKIGA